MTRYTLSVYREYTVPERPLQEPLTYVVPPVRPEPGGTPPPNASLLFD